MRKRTILLPLALSLTLNAFSQAFTQDGINYEVNSVSYRTLNLIWGGDCKGDVVLPESLTYNGVTYTISNIDDRAFSGCTGMTSIVIPEGVKRIGVQAFTGCSSLKSVTFPNSIIEISNMLGSPFSGCDNLTSTNNYTTMTYNCFHGQEWYDERFNAWYAGLENGIICVGNNVVGYKGKEHMPENTSIDIPYGITNIWDEAFMDCNNIKTVFIPSSVTSIGKDAFRNCYNLAKIEGLDKLGRIERINKRAFENTIWWNDSLDDGFVIVGDVVVGYIEKNNNIKDPIVIPDGITTIEENAFSGMNFSAVSIPSSVKRLGEHAFSNNDNLCSVSMSEGLENIGMCAFYNCKSLDSVSIPNSVVCIGHGTFQYDQSLKTVNIPNSIAYVKDDVFSGCESLTSVVIPNGVISIGEDAFENCFNLSSVDIPESVKRIGQRAFYCCNKISSIYIPKGVEQLFYPNTSGSYISSNAFWGCTGLTSILVSADNKIYDSRENCNAIIETATGTLLQGCSNTVIPESVFKIGDNALYGCYNLQEITIPENITDIGAYAFYGCSSLSSITIPNSITRIKEGAFEYSGLTSITIPNSITNIGERAFYGSGLTSITIPNSVDSIGREAFRGCENLISLTVPESVKYLGYDCFSRCNNIRTLNWSTEFPLTNFFWGVDSLRSIVFGKGVKEIEDNLLGNLRIRDPHLETVIISDGITRIGNGSFSYTKLTSVTIPSSVESIGEKAFMNCNSLTKVVINGTPEIGTNAFDNCPNIEAVYATSLTPGKLNLFNPFVIGSEDISGNWPLSVKRVYNDELDRMVSEISDSTRTDWTCNKYFNGSIPAGSYKVSIGVLPSPDSLPCYFHPIIYVNTSSGRRVLYDETVVDTIVIEGEKWCIDVLKYFSNDPARYDLITFPGTLLIPENNQGITIELLSGVDVSNKDKYSSLLVLDRFFLEPLDTVFALESYAGPFMESVFNNATLYVPEGAIDAYRTAEGWKYFKNIAIDTAVDLIHQDDINRNGGVSNAVIYDVTGRRAKANAIDMLPPGLYIINGKKYLVK